MSIRATAAVANRGGSLPCLRHRSRAAGAAGLLRARTGRPAGQRAPAGRQPAAAQPAPRPTAEAPPPDRGAPEQEPPLPQMPMPPVPELPALPKAAAAGRGRRRHRRARGACAPPPPPRQVDKVDRRPPAEAERGRAEGTGRLARHAAGDRHPPQHHVARADPPRRSGSCRTASPNAQRKFRDRNRIIQEAGQVRAEPDPAGR